MSGSQARSCIPGGEETPFQYALRRRFAFVSLKPEFQSPRFKTDLVGKGMDEPLADRLIAGLTELNETIRKDRSDLGEGFCIGHSYFCPDGSTPDRAWIDAVLDFEIRPLLLALIPMGARTANEGAGWVSRRRV